MRWRRTEGDRTRAPSGFSDISQTQVTHCNTHMHGKETQKGRAEFPLLGSNAMTRTLLDIILCPLKDGGTDIIIEGFLQSEGCVPGRGTITDMGF